MCFVDLAKSYFSVGRALLLTVFTRFGIPPNALAVAGQFHHGMRESVRLDDCECSDVFDVEHGLRQGCVLTVLLFNTLFTAVLHLAEKRFISDAVITDSMVQLERKEKGGKMRGRARVGRVDGHRKEEDARTLLGMMYGDDAGIISRSPRRLEKAMTVIVTRCGGRYRRTRRPYACKRKVGGTCRSPLQ